MTDKKISRRDVLRGTAALGGGAFIAGAGLPAWAQDKPAELDLPQGAAGKLTVIHRTEYFEAAQTAFRQTVEDFAKSNNVELDISTTNQSWRLPGQDMRREGGNPPDFAYTSNVSISRCTA